MGNVHNRNLTEVNWQHASPSDLILKHSDVHVYRISISDNLKFLQAFSATLNFTETDRGNKYFQLKDKQRFVISRGAQRNILGRYLNKSAADLQFVLGDNKKPYLPAEDGTTLQYNITHSGDWILLVIARTQVGADIEHVDNAFLFADIINEHFSKDEVAYINTEKHHDRFFTLWTRKEALLKATGQGLGEHLKITPALDGEYVLPSTLVGANESWCISSFNLCEHYKASIAAEKYDQKLCFFDIDF